MPCIIRTVRKISDIWEHAGDVKTNLARAYLTSRFSNVRLVFRRYSASHSLGFFHCVKITLG
jgi:hypothetical protein